MYHTPVQPCNARFPHFCNKEFYFRNFHILYPVFLCPNARANRRGFFPIDATVGKRPVLVGSFIFLNYEAVGQGR